MLRGRSRSQSECRDRRDPGQGSDRLLDHLLYGDEHILVVLLDKAGSINRLGDGTPSQSDKTLYIGVVREPLFDELIEVAPDPIFRYAAAAWRSGSDEVSSACLPRRSSTRMGESFRSKSSTGPRAKDHPPSS
jgi:hypothetical protein